MTVAKEIELEDKFENMGAQMVREVASKTSDVAGDGTGLPAQPATKLLILQFIICLCGSKFLRKFRPFATSTFASPGLQRPLFPTIWRRKRERSLGPVFGPSDVQHIG